MRNDAFWEDSQQASERLTGSVVLYGTSPALVERILPSRDEQIFADVRIFPVGATTRLNLADPLFHHFRNLPRLGWSNNISQGRALYLERRVVRTTRHGFTGENTTVLAVDRSGETFSRDIRLESFVSDPGFSDANNGVFPSLADTLTNIRIGDTIAISNNLAVFRDNNGIRWLYKDTSKVGLFTDNSSILLMSRFSFLKEELIEAPTLPIENISEF
jgi:hypothetical protein